MQEKEKSTTRKHKRTDKNETPAEILANAKSLLTENSGTLPRLSKSVIKEIVSAAEQGDQVAIEIAATVAAQGQPWAKICLGKIYLKENNYAGAISCFSDEACCRNKGGYKHLALVYIDRKVPSEFRIKAFEACLTMAKGTGDPIGIEAVEMMLKKGTSILPYELYVDATQWTMNQNQQQRFYDRWQFKRKKD